VSSRRPVTVELRQHSMVLAGPGVTDAIKAAECRWHRDPYQRGAVQVPRDAGDQVLALLELARRRVLLVDRFGVPTNVVTAGGAGDDDDDDEPEPDTAEGGLW
jgi:hypothetical protein